MLNLNKYIINKEGNIMKLTLKKCVRRILISGSFIFSFISGVSILNTIYIRGENFINFSTLFYLAFSMIFISISILVIAYDMRML
jgi:hypothetical protein